MESIDVHDLPEEEARLVAAFVEFLRSRAGQRAPLAAREDRIDPPTETSPFAAWPLGVIGKLDREDIYDYL